MHRWKSLTRSPSVSGKAGHRGFKFFKALAPEKVANVYDKFMFCAMYRKYSFISHLKIILNKPTYLSHSVDKLEQKRINREI